jgi:hypothetical protein
MSLAEGNFAKDVKTSGSVPTFQKKERKLREPY